MMWCRCFVKCDFYYCMEFKKCSAVNRSRGPLSSEAAGKTDCDLETLVSLKTLSLSLLSHVSTFPEPVDSHKQPERNGFHVCRTRVDGRVTYQEQMVCLLENGVYTVSSRPTRKLESLRNSETVHRTDNWSKWEGFMLLTETLNSENTFSSDVNHIHRAQLSLEAFLQNPNHLFSRAKEVINSHKLSQQTHSPIGQCVKMTRKANVQENTDNMK